MLGCRLPWVRGRLVDLLIVAQTRRMPLLPEAGHGTCGTHGSCQGRGSGVPCYHGWEGGRSGQWRDGLPCHGSRLV